MKQLTLPKQVQQFIKRYENLELGGKKVIAPYFINHTKQKDLRAMVGKGTPEEIEIEAKIWEKLKGINFTSMSNKEIRKFLQERGLGIDCSGFVAHVLGFWYKLEAKKSLWTKLKPLKKGALGFFSTIAYRLKPVQNLGVISLTSNINSETVSINQVLPGDIIRSGWKKKNSFHIFLVEKVELNDSGKVQTIFYVNSTHHYGDSNGIRHGKINIIDATKPLHEQEWDDDDENGVNFSLEGYLQDLEYNGLRRLYPMEEIQVSNQLDI